MSSLEAKKIAPATGTTVTLGAAGDTVDVSATALKTNTIKDAGGNTLFTSDGSGTLSSVNSALKGGMIFISTQTVTAQTSLSITSGLDSTYKEYVFILTGINPSANAEICFQCSTDGGSNYNTTLTSSAFAAYHTEADGSGITYKAGEDQAQGTSPQRFTENCANHADAGAAIMLHLFNPASTTYVKNFYARSAFMSNNSGSTIMYVAGYFDTTSALNAIQFSMESGNFDGTVAMYGTG